MNQLLALCAALAACLLVGVLVFLLARRSMVPADTLTEARRHLEAAEIALDTLRNAKAQADTALAVQTEKAALAETSEQRFQNAAGLMQETERELVHAGSDMAALREVRAGLEAALSDCKDKLAEAEQATVAVRKALDDVRDEKARQGKQLATVTETLAQERRAATEKLELLQGARDALALQFKSLAEDLMLRHSETFKAQNLAQVEQLLGPMREKLADFRTGLETAQTETVKERAALGEHIRSLTEHSGRLSSETTALTRALKGDTRLQGVWGEMLLESLLERSGLVEDEHYITQTGFMGEAGRNLRPDVVVRLPGDQNVVVDSKVSLLAFEEFVNADDDSVRAAALARHRASVRAHIAGLGKKDYAEVASSRLGYVIMFVPIEGALSAALTADPNLTAFALEHQVCIATPVTLMAMLRTVSVVWRTEQRNRNAEAIAARAGAVYDKLAGFVVDLQKVGTCLERPRPPTTWRSRSSRPAAATSWARSSCSSAWARKPARRCPSRCSPPPGWTNSKTCRERRTSPSRQACEMRRT